MPDILMEAKANQALQSDIERAMQRFGDRISIAEKAYLESTHRPMPHHLKSAMARTLMNTEAEFSNPNIRYLAEETTPGDINAFIHHAFDMISAIIPSTVIEEFATIQAMDKRVGEIFFMDIVTGSAKAPKAKGDFYLSSQYGPNTGQNYSDERVIDEQIGVGTGAQLVFNGNLSWTPVKGQPVKAAATTATFVIAGIAGVVTFDATGAVIPTAQVTGGGINLSTGAISLTFAAAPDATTPILVQYEYNSTDPQAFAQNGVGVPEVDIRVTSSIVTATRRALKTKWLLDTAAMLTKEHGKDIEQELLDGVIAGVMNEVAVEAASDIRAAANAGTEVTFSKTPVSPQIPYIVHLQNFLPVIIQADTNIESAVRKVKANFIIGGASVVQVIKALPVDLFKPATYSEAVPVGMHVIGNLNGQYKVIQNFDYLPGDFVVGAKGNNWLLTGYVYAPFIPIMTSKPIVDENLNVFRSLLTYYGKKMVNSKFYNQGRVTL